MTTNPNQEITTDTGIEVRSYEGVEHLMPQAPRARAPANDGQTTFFDIDNLKGEFPVEEKAPPLIDSIAIRKMLESGELPRYSAIICQVFAHKYRPGDKEVLFTKQDLLAAAHEIGTEPPANLGDMVYSARHREGLPDLIRSTAPDRFEWQLETIGRGRYRFVLVTNARITIFDDCKSVAVVDQSSPALRACCLSVSTRLELTIRENSLLERFLAMPLVRVQGKTRTFLKGIGQTEIDGILMSAEDMAEPVIVPLQVIGSPDPLRPAQASLGAQVAEEKYPDLVHRPVIAQALNEGEIAMFEIRLDQGEPMVVQNVIFRVQGEDA